MNRLIAAAALTIALALPMVALASPYDRGCGNQGSLVGSGSNSWITAHEHAGMSHQTAASIARRVGVEEFGHHARPSDAPCAIAASVSDNAARAWLHWSGNDGWIGASWIGYSRGPYVGRFYCTGYSQSSTRVAESCHHNADKHAGAITVTFNLVAASSTTLTVKDDEERRVKTS